MSTNNNPLSPNFHVDVMPKLCRAGILISCDVHVNFGDGSESLLVTKYISTDSLYLYTVHTARFN